MTERNRKLQPEQMKKKTQSNITSAASSADSLKISGKLKETIALAAFVLVIALMSVLTMDLLLIPVVFFAKSQPALYTEIFTVALASLITVYFIYRIAMTVLFWIKNGFSLKEVFASFLSGRLRAFLVFVLTFIAVILCIIVIYYLFRYNTSLITDMAG